MDCSDTFFSVLHDAIVNVESEDDVYAEIIRKWLTTPGVDVNAYHWQENNNALLHDVCDTKNIKTAVGARLLLCDDRCDVNLQSRLGETALFFAVRSVKYKNTAHVDILKLLMSHPRIDINLRGANGMCALHVACSSPFIPPTGAQLLLSDERCDVNLQDDDGDTPLGLALPNVRSLDDNLGSVVRLLLQRHDIEVNVPGLPALWLFLGSSDEKHEFKSSKEVMDVVQLLLSRGADPNATKALLANAINFCSVDVCRELLKHCADPNSMFNNIGEMAQESAIHCAVKLDSLSKTTLLLEYNVDCSVTFRNMDLFELGRLYGCRQEILDQVRKSMGLQTKLLNENVLADCEKISDDTALWRRSISTKLRLQNTAKSKLDPLQTIKRCRTELIVHQQECADIKHVIFSMLNSMSDNLPREFSHLRFTPVLCGSMSEDTKCYQPDELDFMCKLEIKGEYKNDLFEIDDVRSCANIMGSSGCLDVVKLATAFYKAVEQTLRQSKLATKCSFSDLSPDFLYGNQISKLKVVYNGEFFKNMAIYIDLVPALWKDHEYKGPTLLGLDFKEFYGITKVSRLRPPSNETRFPVSYSHAEQAIIAAIPVNVRNGLILAKAARIASIARPAEDDLTSHYGLQEDIHVDDYITSYLLKTSLFKLLPNHARSDSCNCNDVTSTLSHGFWYKSELNDFATLTGSKPSDSTSEGDKDVTPEDDKDVTSENDKDVTSEDDKDVVSEDDKDVMSKDDKTIKEGATVKPTEGESTDENDAEASDSKEDDTESLFSCWWEEVQEDSACDWAIMIYAQLETDLNIYKIGCWYEDYSTLLDCQYCRIERSCCKRRKLILGMTSQILKFLEEHREELNEIDFGDNDVSVTISEHDDGNAADRELFDCDTLMTSKRQNSKYADESCTKRRKANQCDDEKRLYPIGRHEVYRRDVNGSGSGSGFFTIRNASAHKP